MNVFGKKTVTEEWNKLDMESIFKKKFSIDVKIFTDFLVLTIILKE